MSFPKTALFLITLVQFAPSTFAANADFQLICSGNDFETPLVITGQNGSISAEGHWDVINAIGDGDYRRVTATQTGAVLTLAESNEFRAVLTTQNNQLYSGTVQMADESGQGVPAYSGRISCKRK